MQNNKDLEHLREFVRSIIKEKNLVGTPDEIVDELVDDLTNRLVEQMNRALLNELTDEQLTNFEALVDAEDKSKLNTFFVDNKVPVKAVVTSVMLRFKNAYLAS